MDESRRNFLKKLIGGGILGAISFLALRRYLASYLPLNLGEGGKVVEREGKKVKLPEPRFESNTSVEEAIEGRRSRRSYKEEKLTLKQISQLLWSAQGITGETFKRAAPSAGALYPLEVFLVAGKVKGLATGTYHYKPENHYLTKISKKDVREELSKAALGQRWVREAPIDFVFVGVYERTKSKYGKRGERYVHLEAGHAAENIYLQAESLNLKTVVVGAFRDNQVRKILGLSKGEQPLYIIPVGK